jgi:hypothetical protein
MRFKKALKVFAPKTLKHCGIKWDLKNTIKKCLKKDAFNDSVKNSHKNGLTNLWFKLVSKGRKSIFFPLPLRFN